MHKEDRCAQNLNLMQEDALVGLMYEDFGKNDMKHLDYDKVRRFAVSIQTDPEICDRLDCETVSEEQAWSPPDVWITDMCMAFINAAKEEKKREREAAFGGPKFEYDPKNPHARGSTHRNGPKAPASPYNAKAGRLQSSRAKSSNAFDSKLLVALSAMSSASTNQA